MRVTAHETVYDGVEASWATNSVDGLAKETLQITAILVYICTYVS